MIPEMWEYAIARIVEIVPTAGGLIVSQGHHTAVITAGDLSYAAATLEDTSAGVVQIKGLWLGAEQVERLQRIPMIQRGGGDRG